MRIIDADELKKQAYKSGDWDKPLVVDVEAIDDAPTVDQWYYPANGELPEKDGEYLCRYYKYDLRFSKLAHYRVEDNKWYHIIYDEEYRMPKPDAWQYIVPPKEEA